MIYDFDKKINRKLSKCRKWDNTILKEKFQVDENAIPLDLADLDFECAPAIKKAITERAILGDYGYTYCYDEYYDSVIRWCKDRFNLDIQKDWIKLTFGTCATLHYIVQCFCSKGDSVMINTPAYKPFSDSVLRNECNLITSPLIEKKLRYYLDFEDIEKKIKENNVKLYILCSPQNPSGRIWSKDELFKLSEICVKNNVLLVSDEIHRDIILDDNVFTSLWNAHPEISDHSIVCVSLNKGFNLGGLKSSYIVVKNNQIRKRMLIYLQKVYVTSPHVFIVPATVAAYNESREWLDEMVKYINNNFKYAYKWFAKYMPEARVMKAEASFLLWIDMRKIFSSEKEMKEFFIKSNITAVFGSSFVADGDGWVRINLGTQLSTLKEAFERMEKTIKKSNNIE